MGVHNMDVYPEIRRLLGIPEDEPIFILRAQDTISLETLAEYAVLAHDVGVSKEFQKELAHCSIAFAAWRNSNHDKVKAPD